ncbi:MAG: hypothetical protein M1833_003071 [Piccolia ochrophora]|nr:MAG: hypothetical protein M1833_003071 [Piccolia ochrophora]
MPKRKRDPSESHAPTPDQRKRELEKKMVHGKKRLNHALKLAKAFERQKLGKRITKAKGEQDQPESVARLEREVEALKSLNLPVMAEAHLYKSLAKAKDIAASPLFVDEIQQRLPTLGVEQLDQAKSNVTARLYNSKHVKENVQQTLSNVRLVLGLNSKSVEGTNTVRAKDGQASRQASKPKESGENIRNRSVSVGERPSPSPSNAMEPDSQTGTPVDPAIPEDEEPIGQRPGLASPSDVDVPSGYSSSRSVDAPGSSSDPRSTSPEPRKSSKAKRKPVADSTFLPSLMMGGYFSGSESAEEVDDIAERKNRMGQRARQQLWERKFGQRANHVTKAARDQGWDAKLGALADTTRSKTRRGQSGASRSGGPERPWFGSNSERVDKKPSKSRPEKESEGPLHPSWEAAKKAKEQEKGTNFQGKKVVFD